MILLEAASLFAAHGFSASTNDLADKMGVRKTLIYKYFASKEVLIEEVVKIFLNSSWTSGVSAVIYDRTLSLEDRLIAYFVSMLENEQEKSICLMFRLVLDGWELPTRLFQDLENTLILPLIIEMRHIYKLPNVRSLALMDGERELALALYGSIYFYSIRRHVFKTRICDDQNEIIKMYVTHFLKGIAETLSDFHQPDAPKSLTKPVVES